MKWEDNRRSSNVEDRRGESPSNFGSSNNNSMMMLLPVIKMLIGTKIGRIVLIVGVVAYFMGLSEATLWAIAVLAVIGHCFSPYLNFEGGKGIATGMGVMMFMLPYETLIALVVWGVLAKTVRISSISSLTGVLALLIGSFIIHPEMAHAPVVLIVFILNYKHIPNIIRLLKGEEKRVV